MGWADWMLLEMVLSAHPTYGNITEVGTKGGVLSLYLSMVAKMRGGSLITFDKDDWRLPSVKNAWNNEHQFIKEDIVQGLSKT